MIAQTCPNGLQTKQIEIPESFRKGAEFESYVRDYIFPKGMYSLLDRTPSYLDNLGDFIERTKKPDFIFKAPSGKIFYVETKYRANYFNGAIKWCKLIQLFRYKDIDHNIPVYIVIGTGVNPNDPTQLFLIPIKNIEYVNLYPKFLQRYEISIKKCIYENRLN